jgi:serine/threonine-protein kinase
VSPRKIGVGLLVLALIIGLIGFLSFASFLTDALSPTMAQAPSVVGLTGAQAREALTAAGLGYTERPAVESRTVPVGSVVEQSPAAEGEIRSGGRVTVTLSKGPPQVQVVDVRNQPYDSAAARLQAAGLQVSRNDVTNTAPSGTVVNQEPGPGQRVSVDSPVVLTVSRGPNVAIPNVINMSADQAQSQLEGLGLEVRQTRTGGGNNICNGCVRSIQPDVGTLVAPGTQVTIQVRINNDDD